MTDVRAAGDAARKAAADAARKAAEEAARRAAEAAARKAAEDAARKAAEAARAAAAAVKARDAVDPGKSAGVRETAQATDRTAKVQFETRQPKAADASAPSPLGDIMHSVTGSRDAPPLDTRSREQRATDAAATAEKERAAASAAQENSERARKEYETAKKQNDPEKLAAAKQKSDWAAVGALSQMQTALDATREANRTAVNARKAEPYPGDALPKGVLDGPTRDQAAQRRAVGTDVYATPEERSAAAQKAGDEIRAQGPAKPVAEWTPAEVTQQTQRLADYAKEHKDHPSDVAQVLSANGDVLVQANRQASGTVFADEANRKGTQKALADLHRVTTGTEAQKVMDLALEASKKPLTSTEQAAEVSKRMDAAYKDKPVSGWGPEDAARYTDQLASQMEQHKGDPDFQNTLLRMQQEKLGKATDVYGSAFSSDDERVRAATGITAQNFARMAEVIPPDASRRMAFEVAGKVRNENDLNGVESGLTDYEAKGGSKTFREQLVGALDAQGKPTAANAAAGNSQFLSEVKGRASGAFDDLKDLAAKGKSALEFPVSDVRGPWRDSALNALDNATGLSEKVDKLEDGDSVKIGAEAGGGAVVVGSAKAELEIKQEKRDGKDVYVVKASAGASLGGGIGKDVAAATGGVDGTVEFTFTSKEDAKKAGRILLGAAPVAAGGVVGVLGAPVLAPGPDDVEFLRKNMTAVEMTASGKVGVDFQFGVTGKDGAGGGGAAEGGVRVTSRIDIENGQPVSVTKKLEIPVEGSANVAGHNIPGVETPNGEVKISGKYTLEGKIPVNGWGDATSVASDNSRVPTDLDVTLEADVKARSGSDSFNGHHYEFKGKRGQKDVEDALNAVKNHDPGAYLEVARRGDNGGYDFTEIGTDEKVNIGVASAKWLSIYRDRT